MFLNILCAICVHNGPYINGMARRGGDSAGLEQEHVVVSEKTVMNVWVQ